MRSEVLAAASVGLTALVLANAWVQRQQFYPSVVYITKSNPSMAVIYLQSLVLVILTGKLMRKLFFGQLRAAEFEHLMERSWYAVTETCLAFTVFKDDFSPKFVALFTLLLFLKSFHWLAEERVDYMERSPVIGLIFHLRVLSLALVLTSMDTFFIQHAYTSTLTKGASVQLVFGFEYAILLTIVMNTLVKYVLHSIDLHSENPWENKAVFVLYTELAVTLVRVLLYILFFVIMVRIYTLPLFAVRPMYLTMRAFKKAFNDVVLSRRAIHNMDTLYPDATAEELAATDNVCIICREEMTASSTKKLPCGHIFHRNCLRSWFQRQQTCPTCRLDVLRAAPAAGPTPNQPAQAVFHQQMAALRAQLEAMQAQRQQGGQQAPPQPPAPGQAPAAGQPAAQQNLLQMMLAAQQAAQQAAAPQPAAAAPRQQPQGAAAAAAATPASATPASAAAAPAGAAGGAAARPPFPFPPFPFLPFTTPPPMPPPNFEGLSAAELAAMEGHERTAVEARIRCLRNIQVLLDAAVMEMQQYSAVVARNSTHLPATTSAAAATASTTATASPAAAATSSASVPSSESSSSVSNPTVITESTTAAAVSSVAEATAASTTSSLGSSISASTSLSTPALSVSVPPTSDSSPAMSEASVTASPVTFSTPSETGARPKISSTLSVEKESTEPDKDKNPFESLAKEQGGRTPEQEEMRRKRLAVFEEQKRRLMNQ